MRDSVTGRLAITGANGFVGRHLTAFAAAKRWEVVSIVRSEQGVATVREAGGRPYRIPDLGSPALVDAVAGANAIVHLAGITAERDGASYRAINVGGVRHVIAAAQSAGVPRIIFFSGLGVARYGVSPRSTNGYFLAKLESEVELFRSGLEVVCLRPSYIIGPGSELIPKLVREMATGEVERLGDGSYRLQPIAIKDVADLVLACAQRASVRHLVVDTVGPEPVTFAEFIERVADASRRLGKPMRYDVREIEIAEADRQARAGGFRGLQPDELDVLLCDEIADPRGAEAALGRFLIPLDDAIEAAIRGTRTPAHG